MYPLPNFKSHCWGWGVLTDTNTITAQHALLPALGKQKENSTPLENKKYSTLPDSASTLQGHGRPQRLMALQAAAPSAASPAPRIPVSGITRRGYHSNIWSWWGTGVASPGLEPTQSLQEMGISGCWWWLRTSKARCANLGAQPVLTLQNL